MVVCPRLFLFSVRTCGLYKGKKGLANANGLSRQAWPEEDNSKRVRKDPDQPNEDKDTKKKHKTSSGKCFPASI